MRAAHHIVTSLLRGARCCVNQLATLPDAAAPRGLANDFDGRRVAVSTAAGDVWMLAVAAVSDHAVGSPAESGSDAAPAVPQLAEGPRALTRGSCGTVWAIAFCPAAPWLLACAADGAPLLFGLRPKPVDHAPTRPPACRRRPLGRARHAQRRVSSTAAASTACGAAAPGGAAYSARCGQPERPRQGGANGAAAAGAAATGAAVHAAAVANAHGEETEASTLAGGTAPSCAG